MNRVALALASAALGANLGCAMVAAQSAYGGGRLCEMFSGCSHCTKTYGESESDPPLEPCAPLSLTR